MLFNCSISKCIGFFQLVVVLLFCAGVAGIAQQSDSFWGGLSSEFVRDENTPAAFVIENWQSADGLLRNDVRAITQTRDGYLWVGTSAGVSRFDGIRFTHFTAANTPAMAKHTIQCMFEDSQSRLWIGTAEGELVYFRDGTFHQVAKPSSGEINCITEDGNGKIWIGAGNGLCFVEGHQVQVFHKEGSKTSLPIRRLIYDRSNKALCFDQDGLLMVMSGDVFGTPLSTDRALNVYINTIVPAPTGELEYITEQRQLIKLDSLQIASSPKSLPVPSHEWVNCAMFDSDGFFWIGMNEGGLYRCSRDGSYLHLTPSAGFSDHAISALCQDREGSIWVGTRNGGLHRLQKRVVHVLGESGSLADESINSVTPYANGDGILVATASRKVYHLSDSDPVLMDVPRTDVVYQSTPYLWINHVSAALSARRFEAGQWIRVAEEGSQLFNRSTAILQDMRGDCWFGGHFGLGFYRDDRFQVVMGIHDPSSTVQLSVSCLADSADHQLWVGTPRNGVFLLDTDELIVQRYAPIPEGEFIRSILEDSRGTLWAGTYGRGLWRIDENGKRRFTERDGLPNEFITGLVEDDLGDIWFGTHRGIVRLRSQQLDDTRASGKDDIWFTVFGRSDGLLSEECVGDWQPNVCKTQDGNLWFSTVKGVAVIHPESVAAPLSPPAVVIEELTRGDGETYLPIRDNASFGRFELDKGTRQFDLRFTALTFVAPNQCQFQYQLEGYDRDWTLPSTSRIAHYANVPPGRYQFHVRASNKQGRWNMVGDQVTIVIPPFFWETRWFRSIVVLVGLGALVGVVRYASVQALKRRLAREEQQRMLENERTRIARDMHDRLGSQLTRISLLTEFAGKQEASSPSSGEHIERIAEATRDLMLKMDQVVWAVNPLKDSVAELIGYCTDHAEQFLESTSIACRVTMPENLPAIQVSSNTRYQFLLALSESLNNVVKHAEASEVKLIWRLGNDYLTLDLEDNGIGFDWRSPELDASGLSNMKERMETIGGRFELTSEPGKGTLVRLSINRSVIQ